MKPWGTMFPWLKAMATYSDLIFTDECRVTPAMGPWQYNSVTQLENELTWDNDMDYGITKPLIQSHWLDVYSGMIKINN